jgi:hypothetical protein
MHCSAATEEIRDTLGFYIGAYVGLAMLCVSPIVRYCRQPDLLLEAWFRPLVGHIYGWVDGCQSVHSRFPGIFFGLFRSINNCNSAIKYKSRFKVDFMVLFGNHQIIARKYSKSIVLV